MTHRLAPWILTLVLAAAPAFAQDDEDAPEPPAVPARTAADTSGEEAAKPEPVAFGDSLDDARAAAKESGKSLLVVSVPDWYESPAWARLESGVLDDPAKTAPLHEFELVLVKETRDREVHVRHRVPYAGYPLAVVLSSDGTYLGHTSGLPAVGEPSVWVERVAAIPARAQRISGLRKRLDAAPEDADVLFELGKVLADAGENDRADALFERMEQADPLAPAERLGEARYLRLRHQTIRLLASRKFKDVEGPCLKWRRRFSDHARLPDVLLLQANAQFLAGQKDDARAIWQTLVDDHKDSPAAKTAETALADLKD
jgi:tetratricopeptide (TPR) repeat protein